MRTPLVAALISLGFVTFGFVTYVSVGQNWIQEIRYSRRTSQLIESYRRSVVTGEVVRPATNSDAIQCSSHCLWSLPTTVVVKTASGDEFIYGARERSGSPAWRFIQVEPPIRNSITNEPGI
jgi:hypothetical protein